MRLRYEPTAVRQVSDAAEFGRVAVLLGGDSTERDVSLSSGEAVLAALRKRGVDASRFDPRDRRLTELLDERFDRVWIALHGPGGEDVLIVSGELIEGDRRLGPGTYMHFGPNSSRRPRTEIGARLFGMNLRADSV